MSITCAARRQFSTVGSQMIKYKHCHDHNNVECFTTTFIGQFFSGLEDAHRLLWYRLFFNWYWFGSSRHSIGIPLWCCLPIICGNSKEGIKNKTKCVSWLIEYMRVLAWLRPFNLSGTNLNASKWAFRDLKRRVNSCLEGFRTQHHRHFTCSMAALVLIMLLWLLMLFSN